MMRSKTAIAILLILTSTLASFNIGYAYVSITASGERGHVDKKQLLDYACVDYATGFRGENPRLLGELPYVESDAVRLVIGVNNQELESYSRLKDLAITNGGKVIDTISIRDNVLALVVEMPRKVAESFQATMEISSLASYARPSVRYEAFLVPDDPNWTLQWGSKTIEADWAWNFTTGSKDVLVAIVDTGIYYNHSDLSGNYNSSLGYDWVNNDDDPMDDHGHGTHVSGIVAALLNNIGIAGTAQVQIMAEKVLANDGGGWDYWIADGVINATDAGADIISMSFGGSYSEIVENAIEYAYDRGVILVAASGNDYRKLKRYPAAYDEVIAVGATDQLDNLAEFSNYGYWLELAAPGVNIFSTLLNNGYGYKSGTSMATPYVSAVAALILSNHPQFKRDAARYWLRDTAEDLGPPGFDASFGYGRINAHNAVNTSLPDYDLAIMGEIPQTVVANATRNVEEIVLNLGRQNQTNVNVYLLANGTSVDNTTISSLPSGYSSTITFPWTPTEGTYNLTFHVNSSQVDANNRNNHISSMVEVRFPRVLNVPSEYSNITLALSYAIPKDTINVSAGIYQEFVYVDVEDIKLIGESTQTTTIKGPTWKEPVVTMQEAKNVILTNFKIEGQSSPYSFSDTLSCIDMYCVDNVNISQNNLGDASYGITVIQSNEVRIKDCDIAGQEMCGVYMWNSKSIDVSSCIITDHLRAHDDTFVKFTFGLYILMCSEINVGDSVITLNQYGLYQESSQRNYFSNNNISHNQLDGIHIVRGNNNTLLYNVMEDNGWDPDSATSQTINLVGLYIHNSPNNIMRMNRIANSQNNFQLRGEAPSHFIQDIDTTNMINKKPIHYLVDRHNEQVTQASGFIALVNCTNVNVTSQSLPFNTYEKILLAYTSDSLIADNEINGGNIGIELINSVGNTITNNEITDCISCISSTASSNNKILHNELCNSYTGIIIEKSSDNEILYNDFHNNEKHAIVSQASTNIWNDGYPSGGNHWQPSGPDQYNGPGQNETGSDGIVDDPYEINEDNIDHYPLKNSWMTPNIAVTNITTSKTVVGEGCICHVNIAVENQGNKVEGFDVEVNINLSLTFLEYKLLASGSATFVFVWNTTGWSKGNYHLNASVRPIPEETVTTDNSFDGGWVFITITGDFDEDHDVDIYDIVQISGAYGSGKGDEDYDSNCDIDDNSDIDIIDIVAAVSHYGENW